MTGGKILAVLDFFLDFSLNFRFIDGIVYLLAGV